LTCREIQPYLDDYLADRLTPDFRAVLDEHLGKCDRCREELEQLEVLVGILTVDKVPDPGEKYWDNLESNILSKTIEKPESHVDERPSRPLISFLKYTVSLAAAIAIFAVSIVLSGSAKWPILGIETGESRPVAKISRLDESSIAAQNSRSALISSILLSSPGSFGQQGIFLGRISHTAYGKDNNDSQIN